MVLPLSSASDCTGEDAGTTMPLPLPRVLPESTLMNRLRLPASRWATPLKEPGKSAMAPKSSLPATISLVSGAPLVKFFHWMSYCTPWYLPSFGRYLSSRPSSRISRPPVAQLMVVSWVPMATRMVSAWAWTAAMASARPATVVRKRMGSSPRIMSSWNRLRHAVGWWETRGLSIRRPVVGRMAFLALFRWVSLRST
ncbi:hypothetical protein D9M69_548270 [compost metagenome]